MGEVTLKEQVKPHEFSESYRVDFKRFLDSPGGKFYLRALLAQETELTVNAFKGETTAKQAKDINKLAGVVIARDMLQRFGAPKVVNKRG